MKISPSPCVLLAALTAAFTLAITATAQIPTFASADLVIGQPDFVTGNSPDPATSRTLDNPEGLVIDPTSGKLFVSDTENNRVLRYASATSLTNGAPAEVVFGQANFSDDVANPVGPFGNTLSSPAGLAIDAAGRLWVADSSNNRVLRFNNASVRGSAPFADQVFGQPNFTTILPTVSNSGMDRPSGVAVDAAGNLWVSELGNDRILRFADAANRAASGAPADQVLGQPNFVTTGGGLAATRVNNPNGISVDGAGTLWVADTTNHRVLGFSNAAALGNGAAANRLFGQPNFATNTAATTVNGLDTPTAAVVDVFGALWIYEEGNNRVTRFDDANTTAVQPAANAVLGHPDFVSSGIGLSANSFNFSFGQNLFLDPLGNVWVSDNANHRVLRFTRSGPPAPAPAVDTDRPVIKVRGRKTIETLRKRIVIRGTASDASGIAEINVKTPRGAKLKKIRGTTRWKAVLRVTKDTGRVVVKFRAIDITGKRSRVSRVRILRR